MVHSVDELVEHAAVLVLTRDDDQLLNRVVELERRVIVLDLRGQNHLMKQMLESKRRARPAAKNGLAARRGITVRNGEPETRKGSALCVR